MSEVDRDQRAQLAGFPPSHDPACLRPRAPVPGRHRRDRRPLGRAEARRLDLEGPVPVPRREVAELHRHALAPDLPLLRLRRPRQRGRLPDGAARHGLHRGRSRPRPAGRPLRPGRSRPAGRPRRGGAAEAEAADPERRPGARRRGLSAPAQGERSRHRLPQGTRPERRGRGALRPRLRERRLARPGERLPAATTTRCSRKAASSSPSPTRHGPATPARRKAASATTASATGSCFRSGRCKAR